MSLETTVCTWKHKHDVNDAVVFGGDLAATGSSPATWSSGAFSTQRACALAVGDYLELDFTLDAKANGDGVAVGLSMWDRSQNFTDILACWSWGTDQHLKVFEDGVQRFDQGVITLPMSCRIIYDAGVLTFRSNSGTDTLRHTSTKTVAQVYSEMLRGLSVDASFLGTSGKFHATLKGGTSATPEIAMDGSTGRLGTAYIQPQGMVMENYNQQMLRELVAVGFPTGAHPRPTEGKIWPRNR
jgi:hypothetical protein